MKQSTVSDEMPVRAKIDKLQLIIAGADNLLPAFLPGTSMRAHLERERAIAKAELLEIVEVANKNNDEVTLSFLGVLA